MGDCRQDIHSIERVESFHISSSESASISQAKHRVKRDCYQISGVILCTTVTSNIDGFVIDVLLSF